MGRQDLGHLGMKDCEEVCKVTYKDRMLVTHPLPFSICSGVENVDLAAFSTTPHLGREKRPKKCSS